MYSRDTHRRGQTLQALILFISISNLIMHVHGKGMFANFRNLIEDVGGRAIGVRYTTFPVKSVMRCAAECLKRKMCKMFGHIRKKCGFMGTVMSFAFKRTCAETRMSSVSLPQVLAGACSDHKCTESQACQPRRSGGYRCQNRLRIRR